MQGLEAGCAQPARCQARCSHPKFPSLLPPVTLSSETRMKGLVLPKMLPFATFQENSTSFSCKAAGAGTSPLLTKPLSGSRGNLWQMQLAPGSLPDPGAPPHEEVGEIQPKFACRGELVPLLGDPSTRSTAGAGPPLTSVVPGVSGAAHCGARQRRGSIKPQAACKWSVKIAQIPSCVHTFAASPGAL